MKCGKTKINLGYPPKGKSLASAPAEPTAGTFLNLEFSVMMLVKS